MSASQFLDMIESAKCPKAKFRVLKAKYKNDRYAKRQLHDAWQMFVGG